MTALRPALRAPFAVAALCAAAPALAQAMLGLGPGQGAAALRQHVDEHFTFVCPASDGSKANVYGTDVYTDDSAVCAAAIHAGVLKPRQSGVISIVMGSGAKSFHGSERNGVTTRSYGEWPYSYTFARDGEPGTISWRTVWKQIPAGFTDAVAVRCPAGGTIDSVVWGTDVYTSDSAICVAAVHAGVVTAETGGIVAVTRAPGLKDYLGTRRRGVESRKWGAVPDAFNVKAGVPRTRELPPSVAGRVGRVTGDASPGGNTGTVATPPPAPTKATKTSVSNPSRFPIVAPESAEQWSGSARCTLETAGGGAYLDRQTHTWTLAGGAPSYSGAETVYPATWSLTGTGGASTGLASGAGSFVGGDYLHSSWAPSVSGVTAPIAISVRASDNRLVFNAAHAQLHTTVEIARFIGDARGDQVSAAEPGPIASELYELTFPAIDDAATSTRVSGSSTPVVAGPVGPVQPPDARTTASCTWEFARGILLTAAAPTAERVRERSTSTLAALQSASRSTTVSTPNGSEQWAVNSTQSVSWDHTLGAGRRFDIDLSVDGGTTWLPLGRNVADDGSGNRGLFKAQLPGVGSTYGLVRVSPAGNPGDGDVSDSGFSLGAPWMRLITPKSATLRHGQSVAIQWATNLGPDERYKIDLTYDGGMSWQTIFASGSSGMSWSVPFDAPLSQTEPGAMIRVESQSVPSVSDVGYLRITR